MTLTANEISRITERLNDLGIDVENVSINQNGEISVDGDVELDGEEFPEGKFDIKFNKINGNFILIDCNLMTLENGPKEVTGDFTVNHCDLKSLDFAPETVGGSMNVVDCDYLEDIISKDEEESDEDPDDIVDDISFKDRFHVIDGEGGRYDEYDDEDDEYKTELKVEEENGVYKVSIKCDPELRTSNGVSLEFDAEGLEKIPYKFETSEAVQISSAENLKSLKNLPDKLLALEIFYAELDSFEEGPKEIDDFIYLADCSVKSFNGFPEVGGDFTYSGCEFEEDTDSIKDRVHGTIKEY